MVELNVFDGFESVKLSVKKLAFFYGNGLKSNNYSKDIIALLKEEILKNREAIGDDDPDNSEMQ